MKKLLSVILAIAIMMTLSISAFAEDYTVTEEGDKNTTVSLQIGSGYTITIPQTIAIDAEQLTVDATISASNVKLAQGEEITVTINSDDGFVLTSAESAEAAYTVKVGETEINAGDEVATFTNDQITAATLTFSVDATPEYAGTYTDTVTFTVAVG